ncbi:efflux RND transporter periplasmic adaptor subunit [Opitutus sp. GAS368]|uniref:efflux RND transporter periplasmic adaptor subunit n=1 Tax=Opitutus sp. GAS368 TaxID=1882749 RepID=UPI00087D4EF0|nr:efflux RND transporter periplasmic adaptor subunit [Opitutus sp. GAS368]SDS54005.1 membrane fusion protein, cobalt-zinc-cadmium efflux system [Opitutus sp. GAS368]
MTTHPVRLVPIVAILLLAACAKAPDLADIAAPTVAGDRVTFPANAPQRSTLTVAAVEPQAREVHHVTGRLTWDEDATVRIYTPVAGRVVSVDAALGDRLAAGAPLARLDSPDFGQAQADAHKAAADLLLAERTLTRTKDLFEHGAAPRKDLEAAENAQAGAQSEQQRALARLAQYGAPAEGPVDGLFTLRTPLAGVVVEKNLNPGQEVRADMQLANAPQLFVPQFVISEPRRLWVLLDITEMDMNLLQPGQALRIRTRAFPGRTFDGRLESVGPSLDPATRTVRARGAVDNPGLLLKAEMYVDVEIDAPDTGGAAVAIANTAVFTKEGKHYMFVETAPGSFERREVEPGPESGGRILVLRGLKADDRVLIEGGLLLEALLEAGGKS